MTTDGVTPTVAHIATRTGKTKQAIADAAARLFAHAGYEAVTMREIARAAGCSHTTIYIYFKDKEALLHHLSMGPLQTLRRRLEEIVAEADSPADARLKAFSYEFLRFNLGNRAMYHVFFTANATRVDENDPPLEIQRLRNDLFGLLKEAVAACVPGELTEERRLAFARIYFFMLHGFVTTYLHSKETPDALFNRLGPTIDMAVASLLAGFIQLAGTETVQRARGEVPQREALSRATAGNTGGDGE